MNDLPLQDRKQWSLGGRVQEIGKTIAVKFVLAAV